MPMGALEGELLPRWVALPIFALTYDRQATPVTARTIYDLASLTKVIGTAPLVAGEINRRVDQQLGCDLCRRTAQRDG